MITKRLRVEFPGIYALFGALKRAWNAYKAYTKAINVVSAVVVPDPINEWAQTVSERSPLSYEEALYIYKYITEETDLYMRAGNDITDFIMDRANRGYRYYAIMGYLAGVYRELDIWTRDKLRMRL